VVPRDPVAPLPLEATLSGAPPAGSGPAPGPEHTDPGGLRLLVLAFGALGVVYGDLGTSPLYAMRECFGQHGVKPTDANVYGILSLVFWSLLVVVVIKYLVYMMRADNRGEGGILALLSLLKPAAQEPDKRRKLGGPALLLLGFFGAGLLFGDAVITPAISVLSAVEGLSVANAHLTPLVVPIAIVILLGLFMVQRWGTGRIGAMFGGVMLIWFAAIAVVAVPWIGRNPKVLWALSPHHAILFFIKNGFHGFALLGSVVLVLTGAEALYADMGHFGRRAIRLAWYVVVYPGLLLNYFGQGAYVLAQPAGAANSFYGLVPRPYLYPMIALATLATVIASQALISGAFSLAHQALQLGYLPRLTIKHTSSKQVGQIFIPEVNELMMFACIAVVVGFGSSTALAAAYGVAVTGTMTITSILFYALMRDRIGQRRAVRLLVLFLCFDLAFFLANVLKIRSGGWFPLALGAFIFAIMTTWQRGRGLLRAFMIGHAKPLDEFCDEIAESAPHRVPGVAVFMTSNPGVAPPVVLFHLRHNKVLHERVVFLVIATESVPEIPLESRVEIKDLGQGLMHITARYGFMQTPNVPEILAACGAAGVALPIDEMTFYLGRETLLTTGDSRLARWRKRLFAFLTRNSRAPSFYFGIPPDRVVEMGMQIPL
jgi:KUP system potassium uptake protein